MAAVAEHAAPEADTALKAFVAPDQPEKLREHSAFWMGSAWGKAGFETLRQLARDDRFREKLMFDLSVSGQPEPFRLKARLGSRERRTSLPA